MKIKNKYDETVVNNFIDSETGELIDTSVQIKTHTIIVPSKEQFAITYASLIGAIKHLDGVGVKILMYCSLNCTYNSNLISLTKPYIHQISLAFDLSEGSIKSSIRKLVREKILIPQGSGAYRVNPRYFWKGDNNSRHEKMKYVLEVECPTC